MNVDADNLVRKRLRTEARVLLPHARDHGAQKRSAATCWVQKGRTRGYRQFGDHTLAKPVWRIIFAERVAGIEIDELLIETLQDILPNVGKIVLRQLPINLAKHEPQFLEIR